MEEDLGVIIEQLLGRTDIERVPALEYGDLCESGVSTRSVKQRVFVVGVGGGRRRSRN